MQTEFTPFLSFFGGMLIGAAAVLMMATSGRIAGISGIVGRLLPPSIDTSGWRQALAFVVGLLLAVPVYLLATGGLPVPTVSTNVPLLVGAGLAVGFGSILGNGCTSGHGVCGISRLSPRSLLATATFMTTGVITVTLLRHVFGG